MRREAVDVYRYRSYNAILKRIGTKPLNPRNAERWQRDFARDGAEMLNSEHLVGVDCYRELTAAGLALNIVNVTKWLQAGSWQKGAQKIKEQMGAIKMPHMTDIRVRGQWMEQGDMLSPDRVMAGDYDRCWYGRKKGTVRRPPPLHIFCDISVNCDGDRLFWRGATTCAFAEAAVSVGHKVCVEQVINIEGLTNSGSGFLSVTRIKEYDQQINAVAMATIGANTASLRLTDFGHCIQIPERMLDYGSPTPIRIDRLAARGLVDPKAHTLLIPQTMYSKEQALDWVNKAVADLEMRVQSGRWNLPSAELGGLVSPQRIA